MFVWISFRGKVLVYIYRCYLVFFRIEFHLYARQNGCCKKIPVTFMKKPHQSKCRCKYKRVQPLLARLCPAIEMFRVAFLTWQLWLDVIYTKVLKCDTAGQRLNPATSDNSGFSQRLYWPAQYWKKWCEHLQLIALSNVAALPSSVCTCLGDFCRPLFL